MLESIRPESLPTGRPGQVAALRWFGVATLTVLVVGTFAIEPRPALTGRGLGVLAAIVLFVYAVATSAPWMGHEITHPVRRVALLGISVVALQVAQPKGVALGGIYVLAVIAGMRLDTKSGALILGLGLIGLNIAFYFTLKHPESQMVSTGFGVIPWYLVMRVIRLLRDGQQRAEALVGELEETRAAHAQAAALGERARLARDMHDVLAHSLSALSLQLEGARLLARERGSDPEVVESLDLAHHLAASGLDEASRAIGALRGDELPGPERLPSLVDSFREQAQIDCELEITGERRELSSEARLALYRTTQEALTNVRKHAEAQRVDLHLDYRADGTALVVSDHGTPRAPAAPATNGSGGYGLTGMRERAALLGGRLIAGPTADGFRVELWLPA
jgi:signal transduction histidine kinase